ncbi:MULTISPECIES: hypothetical protein [Pseudomonas]|uniref:Uncharacterized protein n=1 Tax=Pseudomonas hygromyciniae TaxID=2812000 RepID=A0ABX7K499_9PSED|nr:MULTISPECIES: hypothetical protein [Pseudomonas]MBJ2264253.1 hypothetical protein [Pseudomonas sp. MF6787]MBN0979670.1 hypothetical protein [Pseudomonas hygromyciniae]NMX35824.1 hypothetical protein [Pseudomonas sp. WS 5413]QSB42497.1 hypothetical protein JTY93_28440 [Pseudomonas hygromyciniae]
MSARDSNAPHYAAALVEDWARDWVLGPRYLECRHCEGRQPFDSAARAITFAWHKEKCPNLIRGERYPLQVLRTALDTVSPVPA